MAEDVVGRVVHFSPGRVRVRVAPAHRTPQTLAHIEALVLQVEGVSAVETKQSTGSILIKYDPNVLDTSALLDIGRAAGIVSNVEAPGSGFGQVDWRSRVKTDEFARGVAIFAAAALGGMAARAVGMSVRIGSLSAAVAAAYLTRRTRQRTPPSAGTHAP